jgi:outer membrane lipopolysaccharide assembly protein LptE/RlpB
MKSKALFFLIAAMFLSACGYELPKTANSADNSTNSANRNANNQSNQTNNAVNAGQPNKNAAASQTDGGNAGGKLVLSGNSESATHACQGREVEVVETATANTYTLTGECKKLTVDGVSNTINVDKVGEVVVTGVSNKIVYGEGIGGKKPKITKSGTSTFVDSRAEAEKKAAQSK